MGSTRTHGSAGGQRASLPLTDAFGLAFEVTGPLVSIEVPSQLAGPRHN